MDGRVSLLDLPSLAALAVTLIVGATVLIILYVSSLFRAAAPEETKTGTPVCAPSKKEKHEKQQHPPAESKSSKKKQHHERWKRDAKQYAHPWLLTSLKGHTGQVLDMDFSSNGKYLATCADDRSVVVWNTRDWSLKEHKSVRVNVELDHATLVRWSPDSKAFVVRRAGDNMLEAYRVGRRPDGFVGPVTRASTFPKPHEEPVVALGVASTGRFMLTCSEATDLLISDIKGQLLARVDTYLMHTYSARLSPCGRFVAASGFAPDVKVWEVVFSKNGDFQSVTRAFELTGHTSGVYDVAFSSDSTRMATVSKDGTWKLFDINVEYKKKEDPHMLVTQKYPAKPGTKACVALSPTGDVVVIGSGSNLHFYVSRTGKLDRTIEDVYAGSITAVLFDSSGKLVLSAGERHVRVFHNVTGQREIAVTLRERLHPSMSSAQIERMRQQIADAEAFLASVGEES